MILGHKSLITHLSGDTMIVWDCSSNFNVFFRTESLGWSKVDSFVNLIDTTKPFEEALWDAVKASVDYANATLDPMV